MKSLKEIGSKSIIDAKRRGQFKPDLTITLLAKLMGEAGEAVDAQVKGRLVDIDKFNPKEEEFYLMFENAIKNTLGDELADIVNYAAIIAEQNNINLDKHIELKMKYNSLRP